jgi:hypothetical protein
VLGRLRRAFGSTVVYVRSVAGVAKVHWRDASPIDRLQIAGSAALVLFVFGLFTVGAANRARDAGAGQSLASSNAAEQGAKGAKGRRGSPAGEARAGAPGAAGGAAATGPAGTLDGGGLDSTRVDGRKEGARRPGKRPGTPGAPAAQAGGSTPVVVGVVHRTASAAATLAAGLGAAEAPGDVARQAGAVAAWVNAHGGIAGRPLSLRLASFDPAAAASYESAFAGACTALAEGGLRPVAVVGALEDAAAQAACLASRRIPLVGDGPAAGDSTLFAHAGPHLVAPGSMAIDRLAAAQVRALAADGFLGRRNRVGIVRLTGPIFERASRLALRPALATAGVPVAAEETLPAPYTVGDGPSVLGRAASAALRMRRAGVDRVMMLDAAVVATAFMREAERQDFRPRYALNSTMAPAALPDRVPRTQLRGAEGVGFAPLLDVAAGGEPQPPEARRRCESIYRDANVPMGGRTAAGQFAAVALCDAILAVRSAVDAAGEAGPAELAAAFERMGSRRPAAVALATKLSGDRRDGAAEVRRLRFDEGCGCMQYVGAAEAVR